MIIPVLFDKDHPMIIPVLFEFHQFLRKNFERFFCGVQCQNMSSYGSHLLFLKRKWSFMSRLDFNVCRKVSEKSVFIIFHSSIVITIYRTCSSSHLGFMIIKHNSKHCRGPLAIFALKCFTGFREDKKLTDDGDSHHDICKVMTKAHISFDQLSWEACMWTRTTTRKDIISYSFSHRILH